MGYTHIELMGVAEHPFDGSWGYQVTGYYAPTSRYGTPEDFAYMINYLHRNGIGVILDWVPAHFPKDEFGLASFDGTPLYEYSDPLLREFSTWKTMAFDHGRREVRSFLISNAVFWIQEYHIDAIRVDAVGAMLHYDLDRIRWRPNIYGGRLNLESRAFLQQLNYVVCGRATGCLMAEDSTVEQGITEDVRYGGLGFTFKWNIGWMYDTLYYYMALDPSIRRWHHETLTRVADYAFQENFILELCHDECSHDKGSMVNKAPGSEADRMKELKSLYTWQYTHPGKKLLFMGQEFAVDREWNVRESIDWKLAQKPANRDVTQCVKRLIRVYKTYPCLYADSKNPATFEWVNRNDARCSVISFIRRNPWNYNGAVLAVISFSPMEYPDYRVGVPTEGPCRCVFSTYDRLPGEKSIDDTGTPDLLETENHACDGYRYMISLHLRPFESVIIEIPQSD
jgi:1,4-alpha-glucan branching enzyme